jgi:hypothetical protein
LLLPLATLLERLAQKVRGSGPQTEATSKMAIARVETRSVVSLLNLPFLGERAATPQQLNRFGK